MVLTYVGGVRLPQRTEASRKTGVVLPHALDDVYLAIEPASTLCKREGERVQAGDLLATHTDGTPVYASANGTFDGVYEAFGTLYARVTVDPADEREPVRVREEETQELAEMTSEELLAAIRTLGIWDMQSGEWLWRRAAKAVGKTRRIVVDTTDDNGCSFTGYRTSLRAPGAVVNGAKILLHLLGASKIVLVTDRERRKAREAFQEVINDRELIVEAALDVKAPVREETLYEAIYVRHLERGSSADERGVFIVRAQTAEAVYDALCSGVPQSTRWLSAAGAGFARPGVYSVPFGATWKKLLELFGERKSPFVSRLDTPLKDVPASGVLGGKTECVLCDVPLQKQARHCIACGRCSSVCPMQLQPYEILSERGYRNIRALAHVCIDCGCCDYICPSELPLRSLIARYRAKSETHS